MKHLFSKRNFLSVIVLMLSCIATSQNVEIEPNDDCNQALTSANFINKGLVEYKGELKPSNDDWWIIPISTASGSMTFSVIDAISSGEIKGEYHLMEDGYPGPGINTNPCIFRSPNGNFNSDTNVTITWPALQAQGKLKYILIHLFHDSSAGNDDLNYTIKFTSSTDPLLGNGSTTSPFTELEPNDDCSTASPILWKTTYHGVTGPGDDYWYFDVSANTSGRVDFSVDGDAIGTEWQLQYVPGNNICNTPNRYYPSIGDPSNNDPTSYAKANGDEVGILWNAASSVSYLIIKVKPAPGGSYGVNYTINVKNDFLPTPQSPGGVNGANLWLQGNGRTVSSGSNLTNWNDQITGHPFAVTGNPQTGTGSINYNNVVNFDGAGDYLTGNTAITFDTFYAVTKRSVDENLTVISASSGSTNTGFMLKGNSMGTGNNNGVFFQSTGTLGIEKARIGMVEIVDGQSASNQKSYIDGKAYSTNFLQTDGTFNNFSAIPYIGRSQENGNPGFYNGMMAELIMYPTSRTAAEHNKIESYLALKYGITLDPTVTKYVSSSGTEIWNNIIYWNDVFGIGKDDASGLNQSSSNSINSGTGNGTGQTGKGNLVLSNASSLGNSEFLMVGHDNGALTEQTSDLPSSLSEAKRLAREWKVKRTGDPGTVSLKISTLGLTVSGNRKDDYTILIDEDGNGDFTNGTITTITADSYVNNVATFNQVSLPDNAVITFTTKIPSVGPGALGASLWLKANDGANNNGTNLTGWTDIAGKNTFTVEPGGAIAGGYVSNGINFNPTTRFDNSADDPSSSTPTNFLQGNKDVNLVNGFAVYKHTKDNSNFLGDTQSSIGAVVFASNGNNTNVVFDPTTSSSFSFTATGPTNNYNVVSLDLSDATGRFNGTAKTLTLDGGTTPFTSLTLTPTIGGTDNLFTQQSFAHFTGELAELVIYPNALTGEEKLKVESYLALKYGLTLDASVINYVNSSGTSVWNNTTYWHDIFGIGKDDGSGLNQTQSNSINTGSGDGTGQSGKGNIVLGGASSLDNNDFIILGHDNAGLTTQTTDIPASQNSVERLAREWKIKQIGDVGTVDVSFTITGLAGVGTTANKYRLLIDTDGNGDFTNGIVTVVNATSLTGDVVLFDNVTLPNDAVLAIAVNKFQIEPGGVAGSNLWLKANLGAPNTGTSIDSWIDQTGTNVFTKVGTIGYATNAINFNPVVTFNNLDPIASLPSNRLVGDTDITYVDGFAVYKHTNNNSNFLGSVNYGGAYGPAVFASSGANSAFVSNGNWTTYSSFSATGLTGSYNLVNMDVSLTTSPFATGQINGVNQTLTAVGSGFNNITLTPMIGGTNNNGKSDGWTHAVGEIAEIVLFPSGLDASDKKKVSSYLAIKYGISLGNNSEPAIYTDSSGNVIYVNGTYKHDVFGIGKDDGSSLNQTQSNSINTGSGDGTGQNGKGNIVLSNATSLDNNDFLLIGHDNGALTEQTTDLSTLLNGYKRIGREWKVKKTNDPGGVDISFSTLGLSLSGNNIYDYKLIIDTDGDGDFTTGTVQEVSPSSFSANILAFKNIPFTNGAVFTIVTQNKQVGPGALGASLWLKADDGITTSGTNITGWADQTAINNFTVTGTPSKIDSAVNFNPVAQFVNSTNPGSPPTNVLRGSTSILYNDGYVVYSKKDISSGAVVGGLTTAPNTGLGLNKATQVFGGLRNHNNYNVTAINGNKLYIHIDPILEVTKPFSIIGGDLGSNPSTVSFRFNGTTRSQTTASVQNPAAVFSFLPSIGGTIPGYGLSHLNGEVAEIVLYPKSLTPDEKLKVETYLALKYGITLDPVITNYINSAGTVVWNNTSYWHDVFGLGKDDGSSLNQVQSNSITTGSGDGTGQSGKGNIVLSNPSSLDNNDFIVIGHDNTPLTEQFTDLPSTEVNKSRLTREWKVKRTGDIGTVSLKYDATGLCLAGTQASDYKLLIDQDGNGDFTNGTVTSVTASSFASNVLTFDNVNLGDNVVFTFMGTITVSPITGNNVVCAASTTQLSNTTPAGVWSSENTTIATIDGTGVVTGVAAGTVVIKYTVTNSSGCIGVVSKTINVTAKPAKPRITAAGPTAFCAPGSVVLNSDALTGNQWYKDGVAIPGAIANSFTATDSGSYKVISTLSNCNSDLSDPIVVSANATPLPPTIKSNKSTTACQGEVIKLHTSSATNKWFKDGNEIAGATSNTLSVTSSGSYTVEAVNPTGCISGMSAPMVVTIDPYPVVDPIVGNTVVCALSSLQLTNAAAAGVWSSSNTGVATVNSNGLVTGVSAGTVTISYAVANTNGCTTTVTKDITVNAKPAKPIITAAGQTTFCAPGSVVLTSNATSGNQWYKNGQAISGETNSTYTATDSGIYFVLSTVSNCESEISNSITVHANPTPTVNSITGNDIMCVASTIQLSNTTSAGAGVWSSSNTGIATIDGTGLVTGVADGTVTISYTVTNASGCFDVASKNITITAKPAKPIITPTGPTAFCAPGSVVLTSDATTGNQWYKDGQAISGETGTSYTATDSGAYTVNSTVTNCRSDLSDPIVVTANATPLPPTIKSNKSTTACQGEVIKLHTSSATNKWFKDGNEIPGATSNTLSVTTSGSYVVEVINPTGCISGMSAPIIVTIEPYPVISAITGNTTVCALSTLQLSNTTAAGVWSSSNIGIATVDGTGLVTGVNAGTVTISYAVANTNGCTTTVTKDITVNAKPAKPIITAAGQTTFCAPGSVVLSSNATSGNQWYKDGQPISGETNSTYTATDSGIYFVLSTVSNCESEISNSIAIVANPTPTVNPITGNDTVCATSTIQLSNTTPAGIWSSDNNGIATIDGTGVVTGVAAGTVVIKYTVTNASGCFVVASKNISIKAKPVKPIITAISATSTCAPNVVTLSSNVVIGNQWYKDGVIITGAIASTYKASVSGNYTVTNTINTCSSDFSNNINVVINPLPTINGISGNTSINVGTTTQLSNTTPGGIWKSANSTIATISSTGLVTGINSGDVTITYTVTNATGCSDSQSISIKVNPFTLLAVDDDYSNSPINTAKGAVLDILSNDKLNNGPVINSDIIITITDSDGLNSISIDNQGKIVIPQGALIGTYTLTYSICDSKNTANCASAQVSIVIKDECDFDDSLTSCDILVHNAFSPNNDNLNDLFIIERIENYPSNSVEIFDQYGKPVFRIEGYNNTTKVFKGLSNGPITIDRDDYLPNGTYYYVIKYIKPISGITKQKAGYLFLSR